MGSRTLSGLSVLLGEDSRVFRAQRIYLKNLVERQGSYVPVAAPISTGVDSTKPWSNFLSKTGQRELAQAMSFRGLMHHPQFSTSVLTKKNNKWAWESSVDVATTTSSVDLRCESSVDVLSESSVDADTKRKNKPSTKISKQKSQEKVRKETVTKSNERKETKSEVPSSTAAVEPSKAPKKLSGCQKRKVKKAKLIDTAGLQKKESKSTSEVKQSNKKTRVLIARGELSRAQAAKMTSLTVKDKKRKQLVKNLKIK